LRDRPRPQSTLADDPAPPNPSGDRAQDCLAEALTDELTTGPARIRNSFVIARNVDSDDRTYWSP
jgi:TolB-like protein